MKRIISLLSILLLFHFAAAQSSFHEDQIFPIDVGHSYIGFAVRYMGYANVKGRFNNFQGCIRFDQEHPDETSVSLAVDVNSLDTGNEWRDNDLKSPNWFDAMAFPQIFFTSENVMSDGLFIKITGELTIRNVTKKISFQMEKPIGVVKDVRSDSQIIFVGKMTLNRRDFGIEGKKWDGVMEGVTAVSDNVDIELTILGKRINAPNFKYWLGDDKSVKRKIHQSYLEGGTSSALTAFNESKKANGVDVETLDVVAHMLMKQGKVNDAIVLLRKNAEEFPDQLTVYLSYAEAMLMERNWNEARKYLSEVLKKDPLNTYAKEVIRHVPK